VKRDMDLIRELLLKLEALPMRMGGIVSIPPDAEEIAVRGYNSAEIDYHLGQIRRAGFIDEGGARPMSGIGFRCLTWEGHDFLTPCATRRFGPKRKMEHWRPAGSPSTS
jgi:Hypothetical protein (DUF2513)